MSTHRSDTLDEALIQLELEEEEHSGVEHRLGKARVKPPPIPPPRAPSPEELPDEDTARTAPMPLTGPVDLSNDAQALIRTCLVELEDKPPPERAARLHCEIAYAYEEILRDPENAIKHYEAALADSPESLPALRGARRVFLAAGEYKRALPLYETEARLTPDTRVQAILHYERARLLENFTGRVAEAKKTYLKALELDPNNLSIISAVKRTALRTGDWQGVSQAYEQAANVLTQDGHLRAALLVERARLAESQFNDPGAAIDLAESALRIDSHALGALELLERLYYKRQEWSALVSILERQAERTTDARVRALALYELGRLYAERLHDTAEAQRVLARAAKATDHRDRQILEDLAHLYERAGNHEQAAHALHALLEIVPGRDERVALLHKLGGLYERELDDAEHAIRCYQAALAASPTHQPTLQALAALYIRRGNWEALIDMHQAEADAIDSVERRAAAHCRIGEIHEVHLGQPVDATIHYERALALDPAHAQSTRALTRLYAKAGRYRELVEHYERALDNAPNREYKLTYLAKIGSLWEDTLNDPKQAAYAYRRLLRIDPRNMGAIHALQRVTEQSGQYRELVEALELEVRESKNLELELSLLHRAGTVLYEKLNDREGALARFNQVLERDKSYAPVLVSMGRLYYREGRFADLLGVYERQLVLTEDDREAAAMLYKMGQLCEYRLARQDDAVRYYREAAKRAPDYQPAVRALAHLVRQREEWSDLLEALELQLAATKESDTRAMLLYQAGRLDEERLGQPARALERYGSALHARPDDWPVIHALARLRGDQGAWKPLLDDLERQSQGSMDPLVSGAALMRQGDVLLHRLHDPQNAIVRFETLVDSAPGKLPALFALEHLYAKTEAWEALAAVYEAEVEAVTDPQAKVAALRELLNVQQAKAVGDARVIEGTYKSILGLAPADLLALDSVYQLACTNDDSTTLAEVCRALGRSAEDTRLSARYLCSLGQALERIGAPQAMQAYRDALEQDSDSLGAVRGLSRTARVLGDHAAEALATRREAAIVKSPRAIADLLFHSAELRLDHLGDPEGAADDLEQALDAWPDHQQAAERLHAPLLAAGQTERLLNVLSRAAGRASTPAVGARHWLSVANLHLEHLRDEGAGIAALRRGLKLEPNHVSSLRRLAGIYIDDRRFQEAIELYRRVVEISANRKVLCESHLILADLLARIDDTAAALQHYAAVLDIDPHHRDALIQLAAFYLERGDGESAVSAARRMINAAPDSESRTWALLQLAGIEIRLGAPERAESALIEALALEGPGGEAASAFRELIDTSGSWIGYAAGLSGYTKRGLGDRQKLVQAYLELARVYGDKMSQPGPAAAKLEEGFEATAGHPDIAFELSKRLCDAGRYQEGLTKLQNLAYLDATRTDVWRVLAQTLGKLNQPREATLALAPLVILKSADSGEHAQWYSRTPRPAEALPGAFTFETLQRMATDNVMASPATEMIAALSEGLARLYRPDLEQLGISRRDRIANRSRHPIRVIADRIAAIFGVEYDLYLHPRTTPMASIEMTEPVSVVIAEHVAELPASQQAFLLASCMASIAGRYFPVERLPKRELVLILAATTSLVVPGFGAELPEEELSMHAQRVRKVIPRKWRRNIELAAADYANRPALDVALWKRALACTSMRAGLILADDPVGVVEVLREEEQLFDVSGAELLRASPAITDLVRFWASPGALALRRELGIPA